LIDFSGQTGWSNINIQGGYMDVGDEIRDALEELKPKLDELAEGYGELIDLDREKGIVYIRLIGGKLM